MAQTPLQPNYMKVFIQRDYSEGKKHQEKLVISWWAIKKNLTFPRSNQIKWPFIFRNIRTVLKQVSSRAGESDRPSVFREDHRKDKRVFCGGREGKLQHILWRFLRLLFRVFDLFIHRDTLRESEPLQCILSNWLTSLSFSAYEKYPHTLRCRTSSSTIPLGSTSLIPFCEGFESSRFPSIVLSQIALDRRYRIQPKSFLCKCFRRKRPLYFVGRLHSDKDFPNKTRYQRKSISLRLPVELHQMI